MGFQYKELEDMEYIPAPAGIAAPRSQHVTEDGKTLVYGTTVPTDAASGYAPGCLFIHTDGTSGTAVYINEGTATSCDFNALVTGENRMTTVATGLDQNPDAAFGNVYWVDENTGSDDNSGLTPALAKATIAATITVSNAEVGNYNMNTIYVNAQTYSEALTTWPKNCRVIGIGGKVRIGSVCTFATPNQNGSFHNIQFRQATAAPTVTVGGGMYYGGGFYSCVFDNGGGSSATHGLTIDRATDFVVEGCHFRGNPLLPIAIHVTGACINLRISNNRIAATTTGILIATTSGSGYHNQIDGNVINRQVWDPNSVSQMTYGISLAKADGTPGYNLINNRVEAADGLYYAHTGNNANTHSALGNLIAEAGTGASEILIPAT